MLRPSLDSKYDALRIPCSAMTPLNVPVQKRIAAAYALAVLGFLAALLPFYRPLVGFSSLLMLGDAFERRQVEALRHIPHYTYEDSWGYDGQFYVQLALNPTLTNPELAAALDNPTYRARRMLCYWLAWLLGLGQPAWIVQAYALLNIVCWLILAGLLLHWFPPTRWENFIRWAGILFSCGLFASVRNALVDGPALLLIASALWAFDRHQRRAGLGLMAAAGLARETSLLSVTALFTPSSGTAGRRWANWLILAGVVTAPLLLWLGYLHAQFGPPKPEELRNFTLPLAGLAEQWGTALANFIEHPLRRVSGLVLIATVSITAQFLFFIVNWRSEEAWWRVGAAFGGLLIFLATPVWEGFPGAFSRVLLPMTLAFNVLVPAGRKWLPWLVLGNLSVVVGIHQALQVPREFVHLVGPAALTNHIKLRLGPEWHPTESSQGERWRWSSGQAVGTLRNENATPVTVSIHGRVSSARDTRALEIVSGDQTLWSAPQLSDSVPLNLTLLLPPGDTRIEFRTAQPGHTVGADQRKLAFKLSNVEVSVASTR